MRDRKTIAPADKLFGVEVRNRNLKDWQAADSFATCKEARDYIAVWQHCLESKNEYRIVNTCSLQVIFQSTSFL